MERPLWLLIVGAGLGVLLAWGVLTGRLKRASFGPGGVELEAHDPASTRADPALPRGAASGPQVRASAPVHDDAVPTLRTPAWQRGVDVDLDVYFGHEEQGILEITELVGRGPSGSITSIRGVGGIGKTASAYEAVRGAVQHYSMVAWASFRQHQNPRALERGESVGRSSREVLRDFSVQLGLTINSSDAVIIPEFSRALRRRCTTWGDASWTTGGPRSHSGSTWPPNSSAEGFLSSPAQRPSITSAWPKRCSELPGPTKRTTISKPHGCT